MTLSSPEAFWQRPFFGDHFSSFDLILKEENKKETK
jgi:hypothetical protein